MLAILGRCLFGSILTISFTAIGYAQDSGATPYGQWRAVEIQGAAAAEGAESTLTLSEDGNAYGLGACNRFKGEAEIGDRTFTLGPIEVTMMMCPDEEMQQERRFLEALTSSARWEIGEGTLILYDEAGGTTSRLEPLRTEINITVPLPEGETVETRSMTYRCDDRTVDVDYINAGPVSLAVLRLGDEFIVASRVISASGARYAGEQYIWWTRGASEATLQDLMQGEDQPPIGCTTQ